MADITMCYGVKCRSTCPIKDDCYRHTAVANPYRQSYFVTAPFVINEDMTVYCDAFSPNSKEKKDG